MAGGLLVMSQAPAHALGLVTSNCEQGGQRVTTYGAQSSTYVQRSFPSCTVTVYVSGSLTLATLYSDDGVTPKTNPFVAASDGYFFFYTASGTYSIQLTGGGILGTITQMAQVGTSGGGGGGDVTGPASSVNGQIALFLGATGKTINAATNTGMLKASGGVLATAVPGTDYAPAGNYITSLTGDGTAAGPGAAAFTLATVNANVGTFGTTALVPIITVNAKGLITAASSTAYQDADAAGIKGVSTYTAADFNLSSGLVSLDYANGQKATSVLPGFLSAADWVTFNAKQAAGNYITALTGDATASGPGSVAITLATVNSNIGACGDSTHVAQVTLNAKGLATACTPVAIASGGSPGGSDTQIQYNNASAFGGTSGLVWNGTRLANTNAPAASATDALMRLGSTLSGANANGTYYGINAANGYTGDLANWQVNGTTMFQVDAAGGITAGATGANASYFDGFAGTAPSNPTSGRYRAFWNGSGLFQDIDFSGATRTYVTLTATQTLTDKTLTTPTIASFVNANHNHQDAAGGGTLVATSIFGSGTVPTARLGSGTANSTTYLRGDQTWATVSSSPTWTYTTVAAVAVDASNVWKKVSTVAQPTRVSGTCPKCEVSQELWTNNTDAVSIPIFLQNFTSAGNLTAKLILECNGACTMGVETACTGSGDSTTPPTTYNTASTAGVTGTAGQKAVITVTGIATSGAGGTCANEKYMSVRIYRVSGPTTIYWYAATLTQ